VRPAFFFAVAGVGPAVLAATLGARAAEPVEPSVSESAPPPAASAPPPAASAPAADGPVGPPTEPAPHAPPEPAAPAPAAPPAPESPPAPRAPAALPTTAFVHIAADYPGTYLEIRDFDRGEWRRACDAPCDRAVVVDGAEARVRAPGMSDSSAFRIDPGFGTARFRVTGGSALSRSIGLTGLINGIPIAFGGMGLYAYGNIQNESAFETAGIVTLAVGGALVVGSLVLLRTARTSIRDGRGKLIAGRHELPRF
jgi:hypothetical protein